MFHWCAVALINQHDWCSATLFKGSSHDTGRVAVYTCPVPRERRDPAGLSSAPRATAPGARKEVRMLQYVHHVHYVVHNRDAMVEYLEKTIRHETRQAGRL